MSANSGCYHSLNGGCQIPLSNREIDTDSHKLLKLVIILLLSFGLPNIALSG